MSLLSYGTVQVLGAHSRSAAGQVMPPGESAPMHDRWALVFDRHHEPERLRDLLAEARAELDGWLRRPLAPDTTETLEELCARIVTDGWGVTADDCSRAMRCTPTLVRRARLAATRHPESGYHLPVRTVDPWRWAHQLDSAGLSVRQIAALTGVPKSTLHERLSGPRRRERAGGLASRHPAP
jgi:DNA-binding IclR family transcriptional regulator